MNVLSLHTKSLISCSVENAGVLSVRSKNKRGPNAVDLGYSIDGSARHNRTLIDDRPT